MSDKTSNKRYSLEPLRNDLSWWIQSIRANELVAELVQVTDLNRYRSCWIGISQWCSERATMLDTSLTSISSNLVQIYKVLVMLYIKIAHLGYIPQCRVVHHIE